VAPSPNLTTKGNPGYINADLPEIFHTHGTTARERIAQWVAIRAAEPGITAADAAKKMGLAPKSLNALIGKATKEGWLKFDDPIARINHEIIPKVLDNLNTFLDARDKAVTIETAKGTIFKTYQASEGALEGQQQNVLALKIEMIGSDTAPIISGQVIGKPRELKDSQ
jgi:hypothetical protein